MLPSSQAKDYLSQRSRVAMALKDFGDASRTMQQLKALLLSSEGSVTRRKMLEGQLAEVGAVGQRFIGGVDQSLGNSQQVMF